MKKIIIFMIFLLNVNYIMSLETLGYLKYAVDNNDQKFIKKFINDGRSMNERISQQDTLLTYIAKSKNKDLVELLLKEKIINYHTFRSCLENGWDDLALYALKKKYNINESDDSGLTNLGWAFKNKNLYAVDFLLKNNVQLEDSLLYSALNYNWFDVANIFLEKISIDTKNNKGETILEQFISSKYSLNNERTISYLLNKGAKITEDSIFKAIENKQYTELLVKYGAKITKDNFDRDTLLKKAVFEKNKNVIEYFIDKDFSVTGDLLIIAIENNWEELIKKLIFKNIGINYVDKKNNTPLLLTVTNRNIEISNFLIKNGAIPDANILKKALYNEMFTTADLIIKSPNKFTYIDDIKNEIFDLAIKEKKEKTLEYLVNNSESISDIYIYKLLENKFYNYANLLLNKKIIINHLSNANESYSLEKALEEKQTKLIKFYFENDFYKTNHLELCIKNNWTDLVSILLAKDNFKNYIVDSKEEEIANLIISGRNIEMAKIFLNNGYFKNSLLLKSLKNKWYELSNLLIRNNIGLNYTDEEGNTPISTIINNSLYDKVADAVIGNRNFENEEDKIVTFFIENGANDETLLLTSLKNAWDESCKLLIKKNIGLKNDSNNKEIFRLAEETKNIDIISSLIEKGLSSETLLESIIRNEWVTLLNTSLIKDKTNITGDYKNNLLELVYGTNNEEILRFLFENSIINDKGLLISMKNNWDELSLKFINLGIGLNYSDKEFGKPLIMAFKRGDIPLIKSLLNSNILVYSEEYKHLLNDSLVKDWNDIAKLLIEKGWGLNYYANGDTPLSLSIRKNKIDIFMLLLKSGVEIDGLSYKLLSKLETEEWRIKTIENAKNLNVKVYSSNDNTYDYSPLHWAIENDDINLMRMAISKTTKLIFSGEIYKDIDKLIENNHDDILTFIISKSIDFRYENFLYKLLKKRKSDIIKLLIDKKLIRIDYERFKLELSEGDKELLYSIYDYSYEGYYEVAYFIIFGWKDVVKECLNNNYVLSEKDLLLLIKMGWEEKEIMEILKTHKFELKYSNIPLMKELASKKWRDSYEIIYNIGYSVIEKDEGLLSILISNGWDDFAKELYGNLKNEAILENLKNAINNNRENIINFILSKEFSLYASFDVLEAVVNKNNIDILKKLIKLDNKKHLNLDSALVKAIQLGYTEMINFLIDDENTNVDVALTSAIRSDNIEIVLKLLKKGANPNKSELENSLFVVIDSEKPNPKIANLLIKYGAEVNPDGLFTKNPTKFAIEKDASSILEVLLNYGGTYQDSDGNRLVHYAAEYNSIKCFEVLLNHYHFIDLGNKFGVTPLMKAIAYNKFEMVEYLISKGANKQAKNYWNKTPLSYATTTKMRELLIKNNFK